MPKSRSAFPPEFRALMVALARAGRSPKELDREFAPSD
jgi:transposase